MANDTGRMSVSAAPDKQKILSKWQTSKIQERLKIASQKKAKFHSSDDVDTAIAKFKV